MAAAGQEQRGQALPYIGSTISLISKSDIRYTGKLYTIDTEKSTIALTNVRSFGTEDRAQGGLFVPASDEVYDVVVFQGSDIKDLSVIDQGSNQAPSPAPDPTPPQPTLAPSSATSAPSRPTPTAPPQPEGSGRQAQSQNQQPKAESFKEAAQRSMPGKARHRAGTGTETSTDTAKSWDGQPASAMKEEFDFEEANRRFDKQSLAKEVGLSETASKEPAYNPDDFFDTMSCEPLERSKETESRERRPPNTETFGRSSARRSRGGRPPRSGRGRGASGPRSAHQNQSPSGESGGGGGFGRRGGSGGGGNQQFRARRGGRRGSGQEGGGGRFESVVATGPEGHT